MTTFRGCLLANGCDIDTAWLDMHQSPCAHTQAWAAPERVACAAMLWVCVSTMFNGSKVMQVLRY